MSNLIRHAEIEMRRAGLYDKDSDYGGMIPEAVLAMIRAHSEQGHSGGSHHLTMKIFNRLVEFKTLTPIDSNPADWIDRTEESGGNPTWQSTRDPAIFSQDGGKNWYDLDDPKKKNWPKGHS